MLTTTVHFSKVDHRFHLSIRTRSIIDKVKMGLYYGQAMDEFTKSMEGNKEHIRYTEETGESARVEEVDSEIYKQFKITCLQKDISISQGINLALKNWLDKK